MLPDPQLDGGEALVRVGEALAAFGFADIVAVPDDPRSTSLEREAVYAAIDALIERVEPEDPCVFYYFGHGGRVRFDDLPGPAGDRAFAYLCCGDREQGFDGLLDLALSLRLSRLARACGNLTVILDACHSATVVRSGTRRVAAPAWVRLELAMLASSVDELAPESHPGIVRIAGASPLSEAQTTRGSLALGLLTLHLCEELHAVAVRGATVTWDALAHRLRSQIITSARSEHQWLVAAGPRERQLFSQAIVGDTRSVGLVMTSECKTWIWAGALQGVELGDRWHVMDLEDRPRGHGIVIELGLNRARLELDPESSEHAHARLARASRTTALELDVRLRSRCAARMARSAWLHQAGSEEHALMGLALADDELLVSDLHGDWPTISHENLESAFELLEDRARSHRLLSIAAGGAPPIRLEGLPAELCADAALALRLECADRGPDSWFVQLVLIDVIGRPWLLAPSQPEGIELRRGETEQIGARLGGPGLVLGWPKQALEHEFHCTLVMLACGRPLQLGHLARPYPADDAAFAEGACLRRERRKARNRREPLLTQRGGVMRFGFTLVRSDPWKRDSAHVEHLPRP